jgi:hypothetical protein
VIGAIRTQWPGGRIEFRGDSGFAVPQLYAYREAEQIPYTVALITNNRLVPMAADLLAEAKQEYDRTSQKVRLLGQRLT